ncbi:MAG: PEGA domain-containing protein, partial [Gemmatimonadetes bacterium]|nr:PEGA domain-containing protein [Gemmatimonadota bacterium]
MTRFGWLVGAVLLGLTACREPDGPLGGDDAGVLVVRSQPAGGRILLDGRATGKVTPDTLRGVAGLHEIDVELDTMQLRERY